VQAVGVVLMIVFGMFATVSWWEVIPSFFLIQSWIPVENVLGQPNGPAWSLSCEMFMYAMFPFVFAEARDRLVTLLALVATPNSVLRDADENDRVKPELEAMEEKGEKSQIKETSALKKRNPNLISGCWSSHSQLP